VRSLLASFVILTIGLWISALTELRAGDDAQPATAAAPGAAENVDSAKQTSATKIAEAKQPEAKQPEAKQPQAKQKPNPKNKDRAEPAITLTSEREEAALAFIRAHHPELLEVLDQLKAGSPRRYKAVVLDLFRSSERLRAMREMDPNRYELALKAWKVRSRIHLLAARAALSDDESLRLELRRAFEEQADIRRAQLQYERDLLTERLKKADAALGKLDQERAAQIERQYNTLIRQIEKSAERAKALKQNKAAKDRKPKTATPIAD
jgi:hypothetical protein